VLYGGEIGLFCDDLEPFCGEMGFFCGKIGFSRSVLWKDRAFLNGLFEEV